jgi:hypothetical protein
LGKALVYLLTKSCSSCLRLAILASLSRRPAALIAAAAACCWLALAPAEGIEPPPAAVARTSAPLVPSGWRGVDAGSTLTATADPGPVFCFLVTVPAGTAVEPLGAAPVIVVGATVDRSARLARGECETALGLTTADILLDLRYKGLRYRPVARYGPRAAAARGWRSHARRSGTTVRREGRDGRSSLRSFFALRT